MTGEVLDIQGAFLHGLFEDNEELYMEIPEGFEHYYDSVEYLLLLLRTIYGLKNAAMAFWRELVKCFKSMKYEICHHSFLKCGLPVARGPE